MAARVRCRPSLSTRLSLPRPTLTRLPVLPWTLLLLPALALLAAACGVGQPKPAPDPRPTPAPPRWPQPSSGLPDIAVVDGVRRPETLPQPEPGAPCGKVDRLDFPVGAPDGAGFEARWIYGRFSRRYDKYHAGEDWVLRSGDSLGQPVQAIGHGRVTYADPYGWGATDKAVVIVEHVLPDGRRLLSFYGHMEPSSVTLRPGACLRRGDPVGRIGKPRGRPHLHFELRDHLPNQPGPGYWPSDPSLAGWHAPSELIWTERLLGSPGLRWSRPITTEQAILLVTASNAEAILIEDRRLSRIRIEDGAVAAELELAAPPAAAVLDASGETLYWTARGGGLEALRLRPTAAASAADPPQVDAATPAGALPERAWGQARPAAAGPTLLPLSEGGVAYHDGRDLVARDATGVERWRIPDAPVPGRWTHFGAGIVFSDQPADGRPPLASAAAHSFLLDPAGRLSAIGIAWGQPVAVGDRIFVHHPEGIYRIDPGMAATRGPIAATRLLRPLPRAGLEGGSELALPDGSGILISHGGIGDARLVCLDADGRLRWERSTRALTARGRVPQLLAQADRLLLATEQGDLLQLDPLGGEAIRVHDAGRGRREPGVLRLAGGLSGQPLLIDARAGWLLALDPPRPAPVEHAD
ncbi:MAG: M23 family metallopeptidase [Chloroflexi bacterium]|nr:M23 family metallopeptidase [Chloroflexota bacterium]